MYFTKHFHTDSCLMYDYLEQIPMYTGNERNGQKFFDRPKGIAKPESMKYGWTWRKRLTDTTERIWDEEVGLYKTKIMCDYPDLKDIFREFANNHFPDFQWTQLQINMMPEGTSIKTHLDKKNTGDSLLIAFGDFEGGNGYRIVDGLKINYDARDEAQIFNGAKIKHGVNKVTKGKRYSLVFYNDILKRYTRY